MKYSYAEYVPLMKALSDETRLKIIDMLSCGEKCGCTLLEVFNITQPTLSYHMKILTENGLVIGVRDGTWMRYTVNKAKMEELQTFLHYISKSKDECICKEC